MNVLSRTRKSVTVVYEMEVSKLYLMDPLSPYQRSDFGGYTCLSGTEQATHLRRFINKGQTESILQTKPYGLKISPQ